MTCTCASASGGPTSSAGTGNANDGNNGTSKAAMTDLTNITRVILADGYGREIETTHGKTWFHILDNGKTLHIQHDGDSTYRIKEQP